MPDGLSARRGDVLVMVGTRKGSFLFSSDTSRKRWELSGPHFPGSDVFHMIYDARDGGQILAAVNHMVWGSDVQRSKDLGGTWLSAEQQPRFDDQSGRTVSRLWHLEPGRVGETGVIYAGVEPAALFKSEDGGVTWREVVGLSNHATRDQWEPGLGGLCLHSMVLDPTDSSRMWVGISAAGVFGTNDAGESWRPMNQGVRADFLPDPFPEFGQCTHKLLAHDAQPELLYQQNHCGVFRSDSGAAEWVDITEGLPSRFGFVVAINHNDPQTIYVLPEDNVLGEDVGGNLRYVTEAKFRVFRSRTGGRDWEPLTNGLPQENAYLHVMREAMATDTQDPCGIYLGTTAGRLYYSRNDGDNWEVLVDNLPPINSVDCGLVV